MDRELVTDPRYARDYKCEVSVGELYRWILAKLTDKEIKRALNKYRDLMPRQSDWNRKLTQATNIPELGFRYLYRCGQIDESNHRTMQKMLKYIDRQDVLPYFDTILFNSNNANASLETLKSVLLDHVDTYLQKLDLDRESMVHPEPPYEISQCQPLESVRITRSQLKRKSAGDDVRKCITVAKKSRRNSQSSPTTVATADVSSSLASVLAPVVEAFRVFPPAFGQQQAQGGAGPARPPAAPAQGNNFRLSGGLAALSLNADASVSFCRLRMRIRLHHPGNVRDAMSQARSDRPEGMERQLDLFSQTSTHLRQRETGEIVCDVRFTDLHYLETFWRDYITGSLKRSMRQILVLDPTSRLTRDSFDLHIYIPRHEYENGRKLLLQNVKYQRSPNREASSVTNGGSTSTAS